MDIDYETLLFLHKELKGMAILTFIPSKEIEHFFKDNNIEYEILPNTRNDTQDKTIFIIPKRDNPVKIIFENTSETEIEIEYPNFIVVK